MQQQKIKVESLPLLYPTRATILNQGTIEINLQSAMLRDRTSAYHRHNSRNVAESSDRVAANSSQARMPEVVKNVVSTHRIIPQDPLTNYRFDTNRLSTGNFDLVNRPLA